MVLVSITPVNPFIRVGKSPIVPEAHTPAENTLLSHHSRLSPISVVVFPRVVSCLRMVTDAMKFPYQGGDFWLEPVGYSGASCFCFLTICRWIAVASLSFFMCNSLFIVPATIALNDSGFLIEHAAVLAATLGTGFTAIHVCSWGIDVNNRAICHTCPQLWRRTS